MYGVVSALPAGEKTESPPIHPTNVAAERRTYFFNYYNVFCFNEFAFTVQVKNTK